MKKLQFRILLALFFWGSLFSGIQRAYAETAILHNVTVTGECYVREPGLVNFSLPTTGNYLSVDTIVTVKPSVSNSVATGSTILLGSHTLILFPGSTVRILANGIYPLAGRFELNTKSASEALQINTRKFSAAYNEGNFLIEVTPDNGTYAALRNKGEVWFKDSARRIFQLQPGQQLYFPLFGETQQQERLSGFWAASPASFASVRARTNSQPDEAPAPAEVPDVEVKEHSENTEPSDTLFPVSSNEEEELKTVTENDN